MIRGPVIGSLFLAGPLLSQIMELPPMVVTADRLSEPTRGAEGLLLEGSATVLDAEVLQNSTSNFLSDLLQAKGRGLLQLLLWRLWFGQSSVERLSGKIPSCGHSSPWMDFPSIAVTSLLSPGLVFR